MKIRLFSLSVLFILISGFRSNTYAKGKEIKCSIEIMPNYLWHLFSLADLWDKGRDQSTYFKQYKTSVPAEDLDFLHRNRSLMVWGNGITSPYTKLLFFIPFAESKTDSAYFSYLDTLRKTLNGGDTAWNHFYEKYPDPERRKPSVTPEQIAAFDTIRTIIIRNYETYQNNIWPKTEQFLTTAKKQIDETFNGKAMIESWERELKIPYNGDGFFPVLTYANGVDNLPSANNLSASRNNFGLSETSNIQSITDLIIHEIGIFTLFPTVIAIFTDPTLKTDFNNRNGVVYQAIESFIEKKKGDITGEKVVWEGTIHGGGQFNFPFFFEYYDKNEGKYTVDQLLRNAIQAYNDQFNK